MNQNYFITYISVLEGAKTRIKNFHWASKHNDIHTRLDEFLDIVSDFQDSIAEGYMGIMGIMQINVIEGKFPATANPSELLQTLDDYTEKFYDGLPQNSTYAGIRGEVESFIQNIYKYNYLFSLCDQKGF